MLTPTFKQHGPCVETTSRQDNTHYVPQGTHWCAESTSSHVHWSVILPSLCKNNTRWDTNVVSTHAPANNTQWGHSCGLFQHGCFCNIVYFS